MWITPLHSYPIGRQLHVFLHSVIWCNISILSITPCENFHTEPLSIIQCNIYTPNIIQYSTSTLSWQHSHCCLLSYGCPPGTNRPGNINLSRSKKHWRLICGSEPRGSVLALLQSNTAKSNVRTIVCGTHFPWSAYVTLLTRQMLRHCRVSLSK